MGNVYRFGKMALFFQEIGLQLFLQSPYSQLASGDPANSLHYKALVSSIPTQTLTLTKMESSDLNILIFRQQSVFIQNP